MQLGITNLITAAPRPPVRTSPPVQRTEVEGAEPAVQAEEAKASQARAAQEPVEPEQIVARDLNEEQTQGVVDELNTRVSEMQNAHVKFEIDSDRGGVIVQLVDSETDEVIRQLPPEEILVLREKMAEMRGLLFDKKG